MGRNTEIIKIELKSDLCVGSGYSYAGLIDSDVCYDEAGIPYIPAKRLKGCLKEAAKMIGENGVVSQLGAWGQDDRTSEKGIVIHNGYIKDYEDIRDFILSERENNKYLKQQEILEQYTTVKAQTALTELGSAKENSLRFTRTINQYGIGGEDNLCFYVRVEYDEKKCYKVSLENVVKALRHIGMNRTRGLGNVRCSFLSEDAQAGKDVELPQEFNIEEDVELPQETNIEEDVKLPQESNPDKEYVLTYNIRNTAPLQIMKDSDTQTERYIDGQSVLGYFAGAYIREVLENKEVDATFNHLFLEGGLKFSPLYPMDVVCKGNGETMDLVYKPAPAFINRLKKTREYVNVSKIKKSQDAGNEDNTLQTDTGEQTEKNNLNEYIKNGNQPKKLNGKFVHIMQNEGAYNIVEKEVSTELVYHHRRGTAENEELLYAVEAISPGQRFSGTITGAYKDIEKIKALVKKGGEMRLGKSKSAQYGNCRIEDVSIRPASTEREKVSSSANVSKVMVVLESDALFMDENGYTVRFEKVRDAIKGALGIEEKTTEDGYSEINVKTLTGFYGKWNLKRQAVPAVAAGSCFEFCLKTDYVQENNEEGFGKLVKTGYVGERNGEGFGRISVWDNSKDDWQINVCKIETNPEDKENKDDEQLRLKAFEIDKESSAYSMVSSLQQQSVWKETEKTLLADAVSKANKESGAEAVLKAISDFREDSGLLGRVTLMLSDSIKSGQKENGIDADKVYNQFRLRILSIKNATNRERAWRLVDKLICNCEMPQPGEIEKILKNKQFENEPMITSPLYAQNKAADGSTKGETKGSKPKKEEKDVIKKEDFGKLRELYVKYEKEEDVEIKAKEFDQNIKNFWYTYLMEVLVCMKYKGKENRYNEEEVL